VLILLQVLELVPLIITHDLISGPATWLVARQLNAMPRPQVRMSDPVIATDGLTYERSAIEGWLATLSGRPARSPTTGQLIPSAALLPNLAIRELAQLRV